MHNKSVLTNVAFFFLLKIKLKIKIILNFLHISFSYYLSIIIIYFNKQYYIFILISTIIINKDKEGKIQDLYFIHIILCVRDANIKWAEKKQCLRRLLCSTSFAFKVTIYLSCHTSINSILNA